MTDPIVENFNGGELIVLENKLALKEEELGKGHLEGLEQPYGDDVFQRFCLTVNRALIAL